jgi:pre-rRNA-processing protein IPI3
LAWDITERLFFAASSSTVEEGAVHQVNLFRQRDDKLGSSVTEAVGGAGVTDVIRVGEQEPKATKKRLISVGFVPRTYSLYVDLTSHSDNLLQH